MKFPTSSESMKGESQNENGPVMSPAENGGKILQKTS
jgi:hypothetical protein